MHAARSPASSVGMVWWLAAGSVAVLTRGS